MIPFISDGEDGAPPVQTRVFSDRNACGVGEHEDLTAAHSPVQSAVGAGPVSWQMITCADVDRAVRRVAWLAPVLASQAPAAADFVRAASARSRRVIARESSFAVAACGGPWDARSVSQVITAPPRAPVHTRPAMVPANAGSVQPAPARASALARNVAVRSCSRSRSGSRSRMTRTSGSASATGNAVRVASCPVVCVVRDRTAVVAESAGGCSFLVVGSFPRCAESCSWVCAGFCAWVPGIMTPCAGSCAWV